MSLPDSQPPAEATGDLALNDAALIDHALEIAAERPHVPSYLQQVGHDHRGFGVHEAGMYAEFLGALTDVVAQQLGEDWTPAHAVAWGRQTEALLRHLH